MSTKIKYDILAYPQKFKNKAEAVASAGKIRNNILKHPESLTIEEIANKCISGYAISFCHAEKDDKNDASALKAKDWKYQYIYALDFDNTDLNGKRLKENKYMTYKEAIEFSTSKGFTPAFGYTTLSHTEEHHKFRLAYVFKEAITDIDTHKQICSAFKALFSKNNSTVIDAKCSDAARLFFSGKELIHSLYDATIDKDRLLKEYSKKDKDKPKVQRLSKNSAKSSESATEKISSKTELSANSSETIGNSAFPEKLQDILEEIKIIAEYSSKSGNSLKSVSWRDVLAVRPFAVQLIIKYLLDCESSLPKNSLLPTDFEDFYDLGYKINFAKLFGLPFNSNFSCVFPNHEDHKPSARISYKDGVCFYTCFSCNKHLNMFKFLEELTGYNYPIIHKWFQLKFNLSLETEWQLKKKDEIRYYEEYMMNIRLIEKEYPNLYKTFKIKRLSNVFFGFLRIASMYVTAKDYIGNNRPSFYMSSLYLLRSLEWYSGSISANSLKSKLKYLSRLGLINILSDEEIPSKMLSELRIYKKSQDQRYRMTYYSIPEFKLSMLDHAEEIIIRDKMQNNRQRYYCREQEIRTNGQESADKIYVQSKSVSLSKDIEEFYKHYTKVTKNLIEKKHWTTEQEILGKMRSCSKFEREKMSSICLPQMLQELRLQRVPFSKNIESEYNVVSKKLKYGCSKIIIPVV